MAKIAFEIKEIEFHSFLKIAFHYKTEKQVCKEQI